MCPNFFVHCKDKAKSSRKRRRSSGKKKVPQSPEQQAAQAEQKKKDALLKMAIKMHRLCPMTDNYGRFTQQSYTASLSLYENDGKRLKKPTLYKTHAFLKSLGDEGKVRFLDKFARNYYSKLVMYDYDGFSPAHMGIWSNIKKILWNYSYHRKKRYICPEQKVSYMTSENHISVLEIAICMIMDSLYGSKVIGKLQTLHSEKATQHPVLYGIFSILLFTVEWTHFTHHCGVDS